MTRRVLAVVSGKVSLQVDGYAVEIDDRQIDDWEGYVIGEPVELE